MSSLGDEYRSLIGQITVLFCDMESSWNVAFNRTTYKITITQCHIASVIPSLRMGHV